MSTVDSGEATSSGIDNTELAHTELGIHKPPNGEAACHGARIQEALGQTVGVPDTPLAERARGDEILDEAAERRRRGPLVERRGKTNLAMVVHDGPRQPIAVRAAQDVLRDTAAEAVLHRQRERELNHAVVDEGRADLDR